MSIIIEITSHIVQDRKLTDEHNTIQYICQLKIRQPVKKTHPIVDSGGVI